MNDDALSQIDAEIEKLRQERSKDEANQTEIDTGITGLQWLRDRMINSSGSQVLMGIGVRGESVDVQATRAQWTKHKMYRAVPEGAQATLHILACGAQHARSLEDANALMAKLVEVLEFVWPTDAVQEHTAINIGEREAPAGCLAANVYKSEVAANLEAQRAMADTWGLEPQTSTVARSRLTVTD